MMGADQASFQENGLTGIVLATQANFYQVQVGWDGKSYPCSRLLCTRRARLKKMGLRVMVGDRVRVDDPDWQGGRGAIADILPRHSCLDRPPVANARAILLVFALKEPDLDPYQLSRFLVKAESTGLEVLVCLNKQDLLAATEVDAWQQRLARWGYLSLALSVYLDHSLDQVLMVLPDGITIVSGPSGVGKSSLINRLIPNLALRIGAVSGKLGRGRHTTRHVELFELAPGSFLADTPGFNQPDLDCSPEDLGTYFPEIRERLTRGTCQFSNCLHRDEPGCVVRGDWERYDYYQQMLDETLARQTYLEQRPDDEAAMKVKVGQLGQLQEEPKLEAKKYRRISRRSRQQSLQDLRVTLDGSVDDLQALDDIDVDAF